MKNIPIALGEASACVISYHPETIDHFQLTQSHDSPANHKRWQIPPSTEILTLSDTYLHEWQASGSKSVDGHINETHLKNLSDVCLLF